MLAKEIMSKPVITIEAGATLQEAARAMIEHRIGGLPVVEDGRVVGFLTESDFAAKSRGIPFSLMSAPQVLGEWLGHEGIERIYEAARTRKVRELMSHPAVVVGEDDTIETVLRKMIDRDVNRVVVARDGSPVGIVARHDLLRIMLDGRSKGRS